MSGKREERGNQRVRKRRKGKSERKTQRPKSETEIDYVCVCSCATAPLFLLTQRPRASIHDNNNVSAMEKKENNRRKKSSLIPPRHWLHLCTHLIPNICSCEATRLCGLTWPQNVHLVFLSAFLLLSDYWFTTCGWAVFCSL